MTGDTSHGVDAGQMLIDILRTCTPLELEALGTVSRHYVDELRDNDETTRLAELWNVLAIAADHLLSEHPAALNARDLAVLDQLGNTPEGGDRDV